MYEPRMLVVDYRDAAEAERPTFEDIEHAQCDGRIECPECGGTSVDDNSGGSTDTLAFCCTACGEHFDASALRWGTQS